MRLSVLSVLGVLMFSALGSSMNARAEDHWPTLRRPVFTDKENIKTGSGRVLIVTHAARYYDEFSQWDEKATTEKAIRETIRLARENGVPIIYLQHNLDEKVYFVQDLAPDYFSDSEHLGFQVDARTVISAGGYASLCQHSTMQALYQQWAKRGDHLNVCLITPAMYNQVDNDLPFAMPKYVQDAAKGVALRKYGHSAAVKESGGKDAPAIPFSELLDCFKDDSARREFLTRWAKSYMQNHENSDLRVLMIYRGQTVVVQPGRAAAPFTLTYHFVHPQPGQRLRFEECDE